MTKTSNLQDIKMLQFTNIADLEEKVAKLREIRDKNLQETEEFLIIHGIPFNRLPEGFGVNLAEVDQDRLRIYFEKFNNQGSTTREQYAAVGVTFMMDAGKREN